jgi:uncharacterized phage protein gp47/JayE
MTSTNEEEMEEMLEAIKNRYGDVKSHRGEVIEFLGMSMDMSTPGSASITMKGMEASIIEEHLQRGVPEKPTHPLPTISSI